MGMALGREAWEAGFWDSRGSPGRVRWCTVLFSDSVRSCTFHAPASSGRVERPFSVLFGLLRVRAELCGRQGRPAKLLTLWALHQCLLSASSLDDDSQSDTLLHIWLGTMSSRWALCW